MTRVQGYKWAFEHRMVKCEVLWVEATAKAARVTLKCTLSPGGGLKHDISALFKKSSECSCINTSWEGGVCLFFLRTDHIIKKSHQNGTGCCILIHTNSTFTIWLILLETWRTACPSAWMICVLCILCRTWGPSPIWTCVFCLVSHSCLRWRITSSFSSWSQLGFIFCTTETENSNRRLEWAFNFMDGRISFLWLPVHVQICLPAHYHSAGKGIFEWPALL